MFELRNPVLKAAFAIADIYGAEAYYGVQQLAGMPHALHTSCFPTDWVRTLLTGSREDFALPEKLMRAGALRVHATPGWIWGNWYLAFETLATGAVRDATSETIHIDKGFSVSEIRDFLTAFEYCGFFSDLNEAQQKNHAGWDRFYATAHPAHVVRALDLEPVFEKQHKNVTYVDFGRQRSGAAAKKVRRL